MATTTADVLRSAYYLDNTAIYARYIGYDVLKFFTKFPRELKSSAYYVDSATKWLYKYVVRAEPLQQVISFISTRALPPSENSEFNEDWNQFLKFYFAS